MERVAVDPLPSRAAPDPSLVARPGEVVDRIGVDDPGARHGERASRRGVGRQREPAPIPDRDRGVARRVEPAPDGVGQDLPGIDQRARMGDQEIPGQRDPDIEGAEIAVELRAKVLIDVPPESVVDADAGIPLRRVDALPGAAHPLRHVRDHGAEIEADDDALPGRQTLRQSHPRDRVGLTNEAA